MYVCTTMHIHVCVCVHMHMHTCMPLKLTLSNPRIARRLEVAIQNNEVDAMVVDDQTAAAVQRELLKKKRLKILRSSTGSASFRNRIDRKVRDLDRQLEGKLESGAIDQKVVASVSTTLERWIDANCTVRAVEETAH